MKEANNSTRVQAPDSRSSGKSTQITSLNYDASALNLSRRAAVDTGPTGRPNKFLKCKNKVIVSTFNVRTLNQPHCVGELTTSALKFNIDVLCIQEHRLIHDSSYDLKKVSD